MKNKFSPSRPLKAGSRTKDPNGVGAKGLYYDRVTSMTHPTRVNDRCIWFPSKFEFQIWRQLCGVLPEELIQRQVPLLLKPKTERYGAETWDCDFRVFRRHDNFWLNVEAKGIWTDAFLKNLRFMESASPIDYERLVIVSSQVVVVDKHLKTITPNQLTAKLSQHQFF